MTIAGAAGVRANGGETGGLPSDHKAANSAGENRVPASETGQELRSTRRVMNVEASARAELRANDEAETPTAAANQAASTPRPAASSTARGCRAPRRRPRAQVTRRPSPIRRALQTAPNCLARMTSSGVNSVVARLVQVS